MSDDILNPLGNLNTNTMPDAQEFYQNSYDETKNRLARALQQNQERVNKARIRNGIAPTDTSKDYEKVIDVIQGNPVADTSFRVNQSSSTLGDIWNAFKQGVNSTLNAGTLQLYQATTGTDVGTGIISDDEYNKYKQDYMLMQGLAGSTTPLLTKEQFIEQRTKANLSVMNKVKDPNRKYYQRALENEQLEQDKSLAYQLAKQRTEAKYKQIDESTSNPVTATAKKYITAFSEPSYLVSDITQSLPNMAGAAALSFIHPALGITFMVSSEGLSAGESVFNAVVQAGGDPYSKRSQDAILKATLIAGGTTVVGNKLSKLTNTMDIDDIVGTMNRATPTNTAISAGIQAGEEGLIAYGEASSIYDATGIEQDYTGAVARAMASATGMTAGMSGLSYGVYKTKDGINKLAQGINNSKADTHYKNRVRMTDENDKSYNPLAVWKAIEIKASKVDKDDKKHKEFNEAREHIFGHNHDRIRSFDEQIASATDNETRINLQQQKEAYMDSFGNELLAREKTHRELTGITQEIVDGIHKQKDDLISSLSGETGIDKAGFEKLLNTVGEIDKTLEQYGIKPSTIKPTNQGNQSNQSKFDHTNFSIDNTNKLGEDMVLGVYTAFRRAGFTDGQARYLVGEVNRENGFNTKTMFGSHTDASNGKNNFGIISWQGGRLTNLRNYLIKNGVDVKQGGIAPTQANLDLMAKFLFNEAQSDSVNFKGYKGTTHSTRNFLANPNPDLNDHRYGHALIGWAMGQTKLQNGKSFDDSTHKAKIKKGHELINSLLGGYTPTKTNTNTNNNPLYFGLVDKVEQLQGRQKEVATEYLDKLQAQLDALQQALDNKANNDTTQTKEADTKQSDVNKNTIDLSADNDVVYNQFKIRYSRIIDDETREQASIELDILEHNGLDKQKVLELRQLLKHTKATRGKNINETREQIRNGVTSKDGALISLGLKHYDRVFNDAISDNATEHQVDMAIKYHGLLTNWVSNQQSKTHLITEAFNDVKSTGGNVYLANIKDIGWTRVDTNEGFKGDTSGNFYNVHRGSKELAKSVQQDLQEIQDFYNNWSDKLFNTNKEQPNVNDVNDATDTNTNNDMDTKPVKPVVIDETSKLTEPKLDGNLEVVDKGKSPSNQDGVDLRATTKGGITANGNSFSFANTIKVKNNKTKITDKNKHLFKDSKKEALEAYNQKLRDLLLTKDDVLISLIGLRGKVITTSPDNDVILNYSTAKVVDFYANQMPQEFADEVLSKQFTNARHWIESQKLVFNNDGSFIVEQANTQQEQEQEQEQVDDIFNMEALDRAMANIDVNDTNVISKDELNDFLSRLNNDRDYDDYYDQDTSLSNDDMEAYLRLQQETPIEDDDIANDTLGDNSVDERKDVKLQRKTKSNKKLTNNREVVNGNAVVIANELNSFSDDYLSMAKTIYGGNTIDQIANNILDKIDDKDFLSDTSDETANEFHNYFVGLLDKSVTTKTNKKRSTTEGKSKDKRNAIKPISELGKNSRVNFDNTNVKYDKGTHNLDDWFDDEKDNISDSKLINIIGKVANTYTRLTISFDGTKADIYGNKGLTNITSQLLEYATKRVYGLLNQETSDNPRIKSLTHNYGFVVKLINDIITKEQDNRFNVSRKNKLNDAVYNALQELNLNNPNDLFDTVLFDGVLKDFFKQQKIKPNKQEISLITGELSSVDNLHDKILQIATDMFNLQYDEFYKASDKRDGKLLVLRDIDVENEQGKKFSERNHFKAYFTQAKKPLTTINNLLYQVANRSSKILDKIGVTKPNQKQAEQLDHFIEFTNAFSEHIKATYHQREAQYRYTDLKSFMVENGLFDTNLITAISYVAYEYAVVNATTTSSFKDVAKLLGVDEDAIDSTHIPKEIYERYKHAGLSNTALANKLGKNVIDILGLKVSDKAPTDLMAKLQVSIGAWVISAMQSADMVHISHIDTNTFNADKDTVNATKQTEVIDDYTNKGYGKVTFVSVVSLDGENLNPLIDEIKTLNKGTQGYLAKIFDSNSGKKYPSIDKPTKVNTKIKGTSSVVSSKQKAIIEKAQQEAYVINDDMYKAMQTLSHLNNDLFEEMIGALVTQETLDKKQINNHGNLLGKAEGVKRDLDNARDWVDTLKSLNTNKFYDTMFVAQNARMHLNSNVFNVQSSKLHRAMADNESFSVTIDKVSANPTWFDDKGNITPIGYFIRAVFENAEGTEGYFETKLKDLYKKGFTVDKVATEHFNDVAWEYLNSKQVQPAVKAMQRVLANQAKKDDVKVIKTLIDNWGMQGNSLRALVEVAKLFTAIENNTSFTTSLGLGSDGVNNGIAIGTWLLGVMDTAFNNMVGLFSKGDKHQSYFSTRLDKILNDYYDGLSGYVINTIEQQISSLVYRIKKAYEPEDRKRFERDLARLEAITFLNSTLTSRKTLKALLIPFGYGSGFRSLTHAGFRQMLADIYSRMENLANSDKTTQQDIDELNKNLSILLGSKINITKDSLLTYEFDKVQYNRMANGYIDSMQGVFRQAISEYAPKLIEARKLINNLHSGVSNAYISALNNLTKKALEAKQDKLKEQYGDDSKLKSILKFEKLTKQELDEQVFDVLKKAFPSIKISYTVDTDEVESGIGLIKKTKTFDFDEVVQTYNYLNTENGLTLITKKLGITITQFEDTGVSGHAQVVQSGDSSVSAHAMVLPDGTVNQNVHDANIGAINRQQQMGQAQNKAFFHMLATTHENLNTIETTIRTFTELDNLGLLTKQNAKDYISNLAKSDLGKEIIVDKLLDLFGDGDYSLNKLLSIVLDGLVEYAKGQEIKKLDALLNLSTVQQYSTEQGEYKPTKADYDLVEKQKQLVKDFKINTHIDSQLGQLKYIENIHYNNFKRGNDWSVKVKYNDGKGKIAYYKLDDFYNGLTKDNVLDRVEHLFKKFELEYSQSYPFSLSGKHDINVLPYVMMTYDIKRPDDYFNHLVELSDKLKFKKDLIGFDDTDFVKQEQTSSSAMSFDSDGLNQEQGTDTINIWSSDKNGFELLSNLAPREFIAKDGRVYHSVEHAYQTWKSGSFKEATYNNKAWGNGWVKIIGEGKPNTKTNMQLMKDLIRASLEQNQEIKELLLSTGDKTLTHTGGKKDIWTEAFPKILMELRSELKEASQEQSTNPIYDNLGNKTQTSRVKIIPNLFGLKGVKYATENDMVFSLRVANTHEHFGNPFSSDKNLVKKDKLIETNSTKESVIKYIDWVLSENTDINPKQHKFIRDRLKSGELKGKTIIYYKELNEPSHATALDYLINQYNWDAEFAQQYSNKESVQKIILPKSPRVPDAIHAKDQAKSDKANKFIGYGAKESSTNLYRQAWGDKANSGVYTADDKVFVSVNGKRQGRVSIHEQVFMSELQKAVNVGATIITDTKAHRERSFNIGEQELAHWLQSMDYTEFADGEWIKSSQDSNTPTITNTLNLNDLKQLVDSNDTTAQSKLLDWLYQAMDKFNTDIKVEMKDLGSDGKHINNGAYDPNNNTLYINPNWFNKTSNEAKQVLVAHELIHALTEHSFYSNKPMIKKAIDNLTTMREQLLIVYENNADSYPKALKTKLDLMFDLDGTNHLGEFVAYGLTDKYLQEWINKNLKPISKTNTVSDFKSFVNSFLKAVHTLLGLKNTEPFTEFVKASSQLMSKYEVVDVKQGRLFSKSDNEYSSDTRRYSKIIDDIKDSQSEQDNDDKVNDLNTIDVLKGLTFNGGEAFNKHLDEVIDEIITNYAHSETNKRKVNHKLGVKTAKSFAVTLGLSDKESVVYEIQKAIVDEWFKTYADTQSVNELYNIRKEFINQFKSAKDLAQLFNSDWDKLDTISKKQLTNMYTHLTKGDDSLAKLVSLVSSSEKFHNFMQTKREKVTNRGMDSWFDKLMNIVQSMIDWFTNITSGNTSNQYTGSIKNITNKLSRIDVEARNKTSGYYDTAWKYTGIVGNTLSSMVYKGFYSTTDAIGLTNLGKATQLAKQYKISAESVVDNINETIDKTLLPKSLYTEVRSVVNETFGTGQMRTYVERLTRMVQNTAQNRQKIKTSVSNTLQSIFDDKPTKEVKEALGRVIIRTDIQSLLETMNITQAIDMIFNDDKRHAKIVELTNKIQQLDDGQAIINQVKSLSAYMVDQVTATNLVKNAKGIADGLGRHGKAYDDTVRQMIDILATLQAIEYTNDKFISLVSSYKDTPHKLEAIIKVHKDLVDKSKDEFNNNPYNIQKGYASELVDPHKSIKHIDIDDDKAIQRALDEGWIQVVDEMKQDNNSDLSPVAMFYHPSIAYTRRVSGGLDMADSHTRGISIYDAFGDGVLQEVLSKRAKKLKTIANQKDFNPYGDSGRLVVSYGVDGRVIELHYEMHGFTRDSLLERSHDVFELLGTMAGSLTFKPQIKETQRQVAKVLKEDYEKHYKDNPALFVLLDPDSSDQRLKDDFYQIPYETRKELADAFGMGKPIYIRASAYNGIMGYRKYSIKEIWDKAYRIQQAQEKGFKPTEKLNSLEMFIKLLFAPFGLKAKSVAGLVEELVQHIVGVVKDFIVIRSVKVLVGNIIANSLLLMLHGIDPMTVVKGYTKAWVQGQRYNNWHNEYNELQAKLTFAKPSEKASIKQQMNLLQQRMDNSSVGMFMKAGMMNTIVEDISTFKEESGFKNPIEKKIDKYASVIPDVIKTPFNWLIFAPNTPIHKFLSDATQFSDFGAKLVLAEHLIKKGMKPERAMSEAQDNFINFDVPTSKGMQYMNDVGLFMFTKFFLRFQRVIFKMFKDKPAQVLAQHFGIEYFTNLNGFLDPFMLFRLGNNPFHPSALTGVGVADELPIFNVLGGL